MEISGYLPNGDLIFNATGNTYIKMLNDFDKKLCDAKYLQVINKTIKVTIRNPKSINIDNYDEFGQKIRIYPDLNYQNGIPVISHYWTDTEYVPTYIGYHDLRRVSHNTLNYFNINQPNINRYELYANDRILDKEFRDIVRSKKNKPGIKVPNIVCIYGKIQQLNPTELVSGIKVLVPNTDTEY
jgi:hypothetical protein